MNSKARITYRFDKENGAMEQRKAEPVERVQPSDAVPFIREEMQFTPHVGTWVSPFQDDDYALEQLIRDTDGADKQQTHTRHAAADTKKIARPVELEQPTAHPETDMPMASMTADPVMLAFEEERGQPDLVPLGDEWIESSPHTDAYKAQASNLLESEQTGPIIDPEVLAKEARPTRKSFLAAEPATYRPHRGPSWLKVFASVTGAVATGALFGYLVLALFTNGSQGNDEVTTKPASTGSPTVVQSDGTNNGGAVQTDSGSTTSQQDAQAAGQTAGQSSENKDAANSRIAVDVPAAAYSMLQYGVFSSKEGMDATVAELKNKGLAASSIASGNDYRVYVGMSADRGSATALQSVLPDLEVYLKQVEVPALTSLAFQGKAEEAQAFFQATGQFIGALDTFSSGMLEQNTVPASEWQTAYQAWTAAAKLMDKGLKDADGVQMLQALEKALKQAAAEASAFNKKPAEQNLWAIQTSIMDAVFTLKSWFEMNGAL